MLRKEAEKLVGQRVEAHTAANGVYVGTLIEVLPTRPWRGVVEITGVLDPACVFEYGRTPRRGKRPGERLEVGGVNIRPTQNCGTTYLEALEAELAKSRKSLQDIEQREQDPRSGSRFGDTYRHIVKQLEEAVEREKAGWPLLAEWATGRQKRTGYDKDSENL